MCHCPRTDEGKSEEKKKEGSPVSTSSTSKDTKSSETRFVLKQQLMEFCLQTNQILVINLYLLSSKKSVDTPTLSSRFTTFPTAAVTTDNVRNKCRELLVAALQTDSEDVFV